MHNPAGMRLFFVVNPISGGKKKQDWEAAIREYVRDSPHQAEFFVLTGENDKRSVQHHLSTLQPDRVVAVGGDGTVKLLAALLKETGTPLGIIPAGSANGMAKELGIPSTIAGALETVLNGQVQKTDVIRINEEELCIHLSDLGMNAMLVRYFEQSEGRGMWGYGKALLRMLWEKRKMRATIITDSGTHKRGAYMIALANARKYGTGANINPDGRVDDGRFEVVVVRRINLLEICKAIFTDRSFHPQKIEVFSTRSLDLTLQRRMHFQVDGEYRGKTSRVQARILPGVLNLMVPRQVS